MSKADKNRKKELANAKNTKTLAKAHDLDNNVCQSLGISADVTLRKLLTLTRMFSSSLNSTCNLEYYQVMHREWLYSHQLW